MKHVSLLRRALAGPDTRTLVLMAAAALAGCGGTAEDDGSSPGAPQQAQARAVVAAPLLDDDGEPVLAQAAAIPADPSAHTRAGLYATAAQARQLEQALGRQLIALDLAAETDGETAVDTATFTALGRQAAHGLPRSVPILVRGRDLRVAAMTVDRLTAAGYTRVFLVNP